MQVSTVGFASDEACVAGTGGDEAVKGLPELCYDQPRTGGDEWPVKLGQLATERHPSREKLGPALVEGARSWPIRWCFVRRYVMFPDGVARGDRRA